MKKFIVVLIIFAIVLSTVGCKNKQTDLQQISQNLTTYEISLDLDVETKEVLAKQTIKVVNNTNNILKTLKFHLYPQFFKKEATTSIVPNTKVNNAYPNGMSYAQFGIERLTVDEIEKAITFEQEFDSILSVELNSSLLPNNTTSIYLEYNFTLPNCHHRFGYGENTINLANFYPILCVFDQGEFNTNGYHSNGDPFYSDCANYSVNINFDKHYIVAGTGVKFNETIENNIKKTHFSASAVRDFALVLSKDFEVINKQLKNTNVEYYYFNDNNANKSLQAGVDAINTFSSRFGTYPYKTFSIVQCDFIYGGMEYPTLVMISENIDNHTDYINVIIHETAHQWWYGIVGNDEFSYPWLDEALTEFSTVLFYDYNNGYSLTHEQIINSSKDNYSLFIAVYEDVLGNINTSMRAIDQYETEPEYTYCTYVKGVLMFESLYQLVGEKDFINSLQAYFNNNKFKNTTPACLITAFEKTCNQTLENFFNSWIKGMVIIK